MQNNNIQQNNLMLVIDWSNIFYRSLFMYNLVNPAAGDYTRKEDLLSFGYKLCTDVVAIYNIFKPQHLFLAVDGKDAWRKNILPDVYKSNREKDPNINWEALYKVSDEIQDILRQKLNAVIGCVQHGEADDIIAMTKETLWGRPAHTNMIIVSADADLRQLIEFDKKSHQFCIVYNTTTRAKSKTRRLYVPQDFQDWLNDNEVDLFFSNYDPVKNNINQILQTNHNIELWVENPNEIVLSKIFCGDSSDDVPSIYNYYRNGKSARVTPAKYKKIIELLGITDVKTLNENVCNLKDAILKVCKVVADDVDFNERVYRQRRLVELDSSLFPDEIRDYKDTIEYMVSNNAPFSHTDNVRTQDILEDTEYSSGNKKKTLEASVFAEFDKMNGIKKKAATGIDINNFNPNTLF